MHFSRRFPLLVGGVVCALSLSGTSSQSVETNDNQLGKKPYMGWSTWSLQATKYPGYGDKWLSADKIITASDQMKQKLQPYGYTYINIDSGWADGFDEYGRPKPDTKRFPKGVIGVADYVHKNGQKLGIYWIPGIATDIYKANPPIKGTKYHIQDIVKKPLAHGNQFGGWHLKIDFSKPGAQEYIDSVAEAFASWKIDFLKLDGIGPGSDRYDLMVDNRQDVAAYSKALRRTGRPIWLTVSWKIDPVYADTWQRYSHARRIDDDIETYGPTLTAWEGTARRMLDILPWEDRASALTGWNDLDSLCVGVGEMDGLTNAERRTMMTFWAIACSPLYAGDDLTKLDNFGLSLLTNKEVIAVNQRGHAARQYVDGKQQVWAADNGDGSYTVALFNLDISPATVAVDWNRLGITGNPIVRDLWSHKDLGRFSNGFHTTVVQHGACLLRIGQPVRNRQSPLPPVGVMVRASDRQVRLSWKPSPGATSYAIRRYTEGSKGQYTTIAPRVSATEYTDRQLTNGVRYHYAICAINADGTSVNTPVIGAVPQSLRQARAINIDFSGADWPIAPAEKAGVFSSPNWNNGIIYSGSMRLKDSTGSNTSASVNYRGNGFYHLDLKGTSTDHQLMRGYIEAYDTSVAEVRVANLPADFVADGYDVYVYCDGGNGSARRTARYTIGKTSITATDEVKTDFDGTFRQAKNSAGNYVLFRGLKGNRFVLEATPVSSTDTSKRAPINAIQIVKRPK